MKYIIQLRRWAKRQFALRKACHIGSGLETLSPAELAQSLSDFTRALPKLSSEQAQNFLVAASNCNWNALCAASPGQTSQSLVRLAWLWHDCMDKDNIFGRTSLSCINKAMSLWRKLPACSRLRDGSKILLELDRMAPEFRTLPNVRSHMRHMLTEQSKAFLASADFQNPLPMPGVQALENRHLLAVRLLAQYCDGNAQAFGDAIKQAEDACKNNPAPDLACRWLGKAKGMAAAPESSDGPLQV